MIRRADQRILFRDISARDDIYYNNKNWSAELYIAEVKDPINNPTQVTIYNGISWGWKSIFTPPKTTKKFSDSLASGFEVDRFNLSDLTPGSKYIAWTNNDLPSNRCNPNTFLSTDNDSGFQLGFDDNSSRVGNGFASALTGTVGVAAISTSMSVLLVEVLAVKTQAITSFLLMFTTHKTRQILA